MTVALFGCYLILFVIVDYLHPVPAFGAQGVEGRGKFRWVWLPLMLGYAVVTLFFVPITTLWVFVPIWVVHLCALGIKARAMKQAKPYGRLVVYLLYHLGAALTFALYFLYLSRSGLGECATPRFGILADSGLMKPQNLYGFLLFLYVCLTGAQLMRLFLDIVYRKVPEYATKLYPEGEKRTEITNTVMTGRMIGILERALVFIFVIANNLSGIPFILTAKSLARFKQLNDRDFAEYYLIGTLFSVLIALCGGFILRFSF